MTTNYLTNNTVSASTQSIPHLSSHSTYTSTRIYTLTTHNHNLKRSLEWGLHEERDHLTINPFFLMSSIFPPHQHIVIVPRAPLRVEGKLREREWGGSSSSPWTPSGVLNPNLALATFRRHNFLPLPSRIVTNNFNSNQGSNVSIWLVH